VLTEIKYDYIIHKVLEFDEVVTMLGISVKLDNIDFVQTG